jgi:hypothetical protein
VTTAVGNTFNVSTTATYYKYGPVEEVDYNQATYPYGISGPYYVPTVISANSGTQTVISQPKSITESTEQKPEWLPEKFKSAEELAKAYSELEKKFSSNNKGAKQETPKNKSEEVKAEGFTLDKYNQEYVEAGALSDNSYAELAKLGLDKNLVDGYIEGQKAISDNYQKQIYNEVGSQEQYTQLVDWASKNLSDEEVESFNDVVSNGSIQAMKFAVRGLMATAGMKQSSVKQQDLFQGDSDFISVDAFQSIAQVTQAMNDPRYEKDPAYRKEVTDKIARSSVL